MLIEEFEARMVNLSSWNLRYNRGMPYNMLLVRNDALKCYKNDGLEIGGIQVCWRIMKFQGLECMLVTKRGFHVCIA
jgi:hypothetical protein